MASYKRQHEPLYDSFDYPAAAGPLVQTLFAPRQGVNRYETNLTKDGSLSGQNAFKVHAIRLITELDADPLDVVQVVNNVTRINVNDVDLAQFHGWDMPAGAGISLNAFSDAAAAPLLYAFASNGEPNIKNIRVLAAPFTIQPNEAFFAATDWPAVLAMAAAVRYWIYLDGCETRPRM